MELESPQNVSVLISPLLEGESRMEPIDGHADVRNDGDRCFGHPGAIWCELCGAGHGTDKWKSGCFPINRQKEGGKKF